MKIDLVLVYKIIHKHTELNFNDFFQYSTYFSTRGHTYKLYPKRLFSNLGLNNFANRIVNVWNGLPNYVAESTTVTRFKLNLDKVNSFLTENLRGRAN